MMMMMPTVRKMPLMPLMPLMPTARMPLKLQQQLPQNLLP
jgi:hypothetical protein